MLKIVLLVDKIVIETAGLLVRLSVAIDTLADWVCGLAPFTGSDYDPLA